MHQLRVLLVCSALLLAAATTLPNGKTVGGRVLKEGQELDSEQESALPDTSGEQIFEIRGCWGFCRTGCPNTRPRPIHTRPRLTCAHPGTPGTRVRVYLSLIHI